MEAQNLTISVPNKGCDKNCPYCISKINEYMKTNYGLMVRNIPKVLSVADAAQVSSVLFTGKGEPFLNYETLIFCIDKFSRYPVEVQTDGVLLFDKSFDNTEMLSDLAKYGTNTIAISLDDIYNIYKWKPFYAKIRSQGMLVRICVNLTDMIPAELSFTSFMEEIKSFAVDQVLIRRISYPSTAKPNKQTKWIDEHTDTSRYEDMYIEMCRMEESFRIRVLPHGAEVFDVGGVAVSFSDYCVQEANNTRDIRSLIFQEDGHLYTSWSSKASILF